MPVYTDYDPVHKNAEHTCGAQGQMAHQQHAKTPKLNALLIGKRTVPSGCRVINVSQQGMSLQCDPDGRLLTFTNGDSVDIYLSVQHANGHNKFTIPAIVSHADENTIDVVFHCTDTELAGLIDSYRTSDSHNLEASINHRPISRNENTLKPVVTHENVSYSEQPDKTSSENSRSFYAGLLILFITSLFLLGAYYYASGINKRLQVLETVTRSHTEQFAEVQTQVFSSRLQDGRYASLNARMKALTDAFQSFEKRITEAQLQPPVIAAAAAPEQASDAPLTLREIQKPAADATRPEVAPEEKAVPQPALVEKQPAATGQEQAVEESGTPALQEYPVIESRPVASAVIVPPQAAPGAETPASKLDKPVESGTKQMLAIEAEAPPAAGPSTTSVDEAAAPPAATPDAAPDLAVETVSARTGPWVINLLSSPDKGYVDNAMANARSRGIDAVVTNARVKGKQYWRLQIPGFDSMAAAKKAAIPVKEQLKIKDVWIFKH